MRKWREKYVSFVALVVGLLCLPALLYSAPPSFRVSNTINSVQFSPFPGNKPRFISSITPEYYIDLIKMVRGKDYEFSYDYPEYSVTYTRQLKYDHAMIPVSSGFDTYVDRRLQLNLVKISQNLSRKSLTKDQRKKGGGLFSITIPIPSRTFESIFGEGGASLRVSGYRRIDFRGRSSWSDKQQTALNRQSKFPTLQMEQTYRFNVDGTIGSKISVKVSQDSRNDIPLANKLLLRYRGGEDDIIKTIEAGNTTLNLPSTQFLKYATRVQGLFGIKTTLQIADVSITAIASQEKGTTESIEITAGNSALSSTTKKDITHHKRTFFDLGRLESMRYRRAASDKVPEDTTTYDFAWPRDSILKINVYIDDNTHDDAELLSRLDGICYIDPEDTTSDDPNTEYRTVGHFVEALAEDYYFEPKPRNNGVEGYYIQFIRSPARTSDIIGVYMEVERVWRTGSFVDSVTVDTMGNITGDTLKLKLIKPRTHQKVNHHIWEYEWRNVYSLNARNIDLTELDINIFKGAPIGMNRPNPDDLDNQNGTNYLQILGIDNGDDNGSGAPDGQVDKNIFIDVNTGLLFLPDRHPFDSPFSYAIDADSQPVFLQDSVPEIYNTTLSARTSAASKYYFTISLKGQGQSTINLNASNIIEGSEVITYKGERLIRDVDYQINYDFGSLTLLDDKYTDLNSSLSIMYEKAPFFSLSRKTLLGTRIAWVPNKDFRLGTTVLFKSEKSTNRKPRIGEETSKTLVWDSDFSYKFENPIATSIINLMPFYKGSANSYMSFKGEIARSIPNPNVDGQVYIDDFEGAKEGYSLGILRPGWRLASKPVHIVDSVSERGRLAWYNPFEQVATTEIWNRDIASGEQNSTYTLTLEFKPVDFKRVRDTINQVVDTISHPIEPESSWNGFMRNISRGVVGQLVNSELLEMRVKGDVGIIHIDLGRISEDIDGDGHLDNEDTQGYRILEDGMDTGYDSVFSQNEFGYDPVTNPDPSGDDFDPNDVWKINGTEGNGDDTDGGSRPNTEDPDFDGLDVANSYFSFRIDLSDTLFEVPDTRNDSGWKTIRVPVRDPSVVDTIVGDPTWEEIEYARIWIDSAGGEYADNNFGNSIKIQFATIELLSTTWGDSLYIADSIRSGPVKFDVAVINDEEDESYTSPPDVEGYVDQARDFVESEQSLLLNFENLNAQVLVNDPDSGLVLAADTGLAVRRFFRPNNYMGYGQLEAFVYGKDIADDSVMFFFRLGFEATGYYEYRTILKPGWHPDNHVKINFSEITGLKAKLLNRRTQGIDSSLFIEEGKYLVKIKANSQDPTLTRIQYFAMGVVNLDTTKTAEGQVWVDELRLTDVRNETGFAARFSVNGNMSDLVTYSFAYSNQDAYYRGVSSATKGGAANNLGSGMTKQTYNFSGSVKLNKFFPRSLEMSLPLSVSWSQSIQEPLLRTGTDITVPEELIKQETQVSISKGFSISESFKKKTKNPLFSVFLNRLKTRFSYNVNTGHSARQPMRFSERHSTTTSYNMSLKKPPTISPLKWMSAMRVPFGLPNTKLYLYPTRLDFNGTLTGSYSKSVNQDRVNPTTSRLDFKGRMNLSYKIIDNISGSYSFNTTRDLKDPATLNLTINPKKFKLGVEKSYNQNFKVTYSPTLFKFVTHKFDYSASYSDSYRSSGRDSLFFHSVSSKNSIGGNFSLKHSLLFGTNKKRRSTNARRSDSSSSIFDIFGKALTGVRYITDAIKPISLKVSSGRAISIPGLAGKAAQKFRFGLTEDPGVNDVQSGSFGGRRGRSESHSIGGGSGVALFAGLGVDVSYSQSVRETFDSNPSKSTQESWPDLKFNFRGIKGMWFLGKIINRLSPTSRYVRSSSQRRNTNSPFNNEVKTKTAYSPLISISFSPTRTLKTSGRYEKSINSADKIKESTGEITSISRNYSQSMSFNASYSFRNPSGIKLPIFGRIKFQSTMSISVDVSYQKSHTELAKSPRINDFDITSEKTNLTIRPNASYSFSSTVKGGLSARWGDSNDLRTRTKRHTRELGIWAELRF